MAFIVRQKMGNGSIHVFQATSHRVEGKANPVQRRVYLGIEAAGGGELLLGRSVSSLSPEQLEQLGKAGLQFRGRHVEHPERLERVRPGELLSEALRSGRVVECGRVSLLLELSERIGLTASLLAAYPSGTTDNLLAAAMFEACGGGALCRLEAWAGDTILADRGLAASPASVTRLCAETGRDAVRRDRFFRAWIRSCRRPKSLICDTTSMSSYAERLLAVEYGYNRDGEDLPQINFNMTYARDVELPLHYRIISGSVPDVATIVKTSQLIMDLGLKAFSFSLDRGFFSVANLTFFHGHGLSYTIGVPLASSAEGERLLDRARLQLKSFRSVLSFDDTTLNHAALPFRVSPRSGGQQGKPFTATAHAYLDQTRRASKELELQAVLTRVLTDFGQMKFASAEQAAAWLEATAGKANARLFHLEDARHRRGRVPGKAQPSLDGGLTLSVAEKAYAGMVKNLGMFMVLNSDSHAGGMETLKDNRSRDSQEKIFDLLKNSTENGRLKVSRDDTLEGRLFIAFLAVVLLKALENGLRKAGMLGRTSVNQALDQARKYRAVTLADGRRLAMEIPKQSRLVIEAVTPGLLEKNGIRPESGMLKAAEPGAAEPGEKL